MIAIPPALPIKSQPQILVGSRVGGWRHPKHPGGTGRPRLRGSHAILLHERKLARPRALGFDPQLHRRSVGLWSGKGREKGQRPQEQGMTRTENSVSHLRCPQLASIGITSSGRSMAEVARSHSGKA